MQRRDTEIIQNELSTKIYRAFDIVDNSNFLEVLQLFGRYYFKTSTFSTEKNLVYVPEGEMPSFLNANEKISPNLLFEKFNTSHAYGLVSTQFLCALNIFVGGEKELSKNTMSEFFNNLSMQALDREDDTAQLTFEHFKKLCDNMKNLRSDKALLYDKTPDKFLKYSQPEFEEMKDKNQKIEEEVVENIISGKRLSFLQDTSYMSFPNTPQEIEEQAKIRNEANRRTSLAMQPYDEEFSVAEARKELFETIEKTHDEFAMNVLSDLMEVKPNKMKTNGDDDAESNIAIFLRVDAAKDIDVSEPKKEKHLPSLTDIIAQSPDGKVTVRRSKRVQNREKPYNRQHGGG